MYPLTHKYFLENLVKIPVLLGRKTERQSSREEGMRGGRVKKVCREEETESQRGTEAEAGDYRTVKAL